jgi:protein-disulfide isomerase
MIGRCVYRQDSKKFWDYHDWAFRQQSELTPENLTSRFKSFAGTSLDIAQIEQCSKDEKVVKEVDDSVAMGRALRIASLPTVFVNGRSLQSPSWEQLAGVIDYELEYIKKAQEACNCGLPNGPAKKN